MALLTRLRALLQRRRVARELDDELAFHVQMEAEAHIARGMAPDEARRAALASFGGIAQAKESVREVRALGIESVWQDVRYAGRTLRARPGFTIAAAGMLALGIGITTAMFTVVDSLLLRPVPFRDADQLAHIWMGTDRGGRLTVAPAVLRAWRESPAFDAAESAVPGTALVEAGGTVVMRGIATVTPGVFDMLGGVRPVRGRLFDATEGAAGTSDRLLISETLWRTLLGADPDAIGRTVTVDGESLTLVGILPAGFRFPSAETVLWRPTDLASQPGARAQAYLRFAGEMPREDALRIATETARAADAANENLRPWVFPLAGITDGYSNQAVRLLAGGVVLVFLVLCANVCSLLLARLTARRREFSMRAALGASRPRLIRQALVESGVLGAIGIAGGIGIAWALVSVARALLPDALLLQTLNPLNLDERALAVTSAAGLLGTLAAGLLPAWLSTRVNAGDSLRVVDRSGTEARGARLLTRGLLVVEIALACTLLVGATLLMRSFVNLSSVDRGLDTSNVTTVRLSLPAAMFPDRAARLAAVQTLDEEFRQLPGAQRVVWSMGLPPSGGASSYGDWVSDLPDASPVNLSVERYSVDPDFFSFYGIPIIRGRTFDPAEPSSHVIVGERLADALWPGVDPVGRSFQFMEERFQVIGLARETHYPSIDTRRDRPEFYEPFHGVGAYPILQVSIRCASGCPDPASIRHRLARAQPRAALLDVSPLEQAYRTQLERPRAAAALAVAFAVIAVLAAAGGLFSVLSYAVGRRRREFGIRTALGATPAQIRRVVLRDGLVVAVSGLLIGSLFAALLARGLASLQYGVTPGDPLSWTIVLALIALTTIGASWRPARSAARMDPVVLLREE
jgi:predicted permease